MSLAPPRLALPYSLLWRIATPAVDMSDAVINEQPEVAAVEETTPAVAATEESDSAVKTTTQPDHKDFKKNRKYDPTSQPVSDDPVKIRGQVCHRPPMHVQRICRD